MLNLLIILILVNIAISSAQYSESSFCTDSVQLYSERVIYEDLELVVLGSLVNETHKAHTCISSNQPDRLYFFSINVPDTHTMSFDIKMTDQNDGDSVDTVLALSKDCSSILFCNDDFIGRSSRIMGSLENGDYYLIASVFSNAHRNSTYKLSLSFRKSLRPTKPPPFGSCNNPGDVIELPKNNQINLNYYVSLDQWAYVDSVKPICSIHPSADYVVKLIVPENFETYIEIRAHSYDNKFDTIVGIIDSDCNPLNDDLFCNDDSPIHPGLGSYVNGTLPSGEYKLVLSAYSSNYSGSINVKINSTIVNGKPFGDFGTCYNPINLYTQLEIPREGLKNFIINDNLANFNSSDQMVTCVNVPYIVPKVIYRFEIPKDLEMIYDIQMSKNDGSNKMDTVLELVNENCEPIREYYNFYNLNCNDDSNPPGGVSSRLNGNLTSGTYKLIATANNYDNIESYKIMASFSPIN